MSTEQLSFLSGQILVGMIGAERLSDRKPIQSLIRDAVTAAIGLVREVDGSQGQQQAGGAAGD